MAGSSKHPQLHCTYYKVYMVFRNTNPSMFFFQVFRAIAKYLVQKYASPDKKLLYPSDFTEQARVDRLLCFDQGILYQSIYDYFKPQAVLSEAPNPMLGAEIERSLQLLTKLLEKKRFVLGGAGGTDHLTIADFSILSSLTHLESMDYSYEKYKPLCNYVDFMKDYIYFYGECCQEGIGLMKDWSRSNLKYLPRYLMQANIPYDDQKALKPEDRV